MDKNKYKEKLKEELLKIAIGYKKEYDITHWLRFRKRKKLLEKRDRILRLITRDCN